MTAPTAVVTGATSGIGWAVAVALARSGYRVTIVGRDPARCEAARARLLAFGGPPPGDAVIADLTLLAQVRSAARTIRATHPSVALLVNNAGALFARREETVEGHERTFALNVLAPFLLTRDLLPALRAHGGGARVVNVASAAHRRAQLDLQDLELKSRYSGFRAYARSKLALVLLTHAFARRSPANEVGHFAVHPGFVRSRFGRTDPGLLATAIRAAMLVGISPVRAARRVAYAATSGELTGMTGGYVTRRHLAESSARSRDARLGEGLWDAVEASDRARLGGRGHALGTGALVGGTVR